MSQNHTILRERILQVLQECKKLLAAHDEASALLDEIEKSRQHLMQPMQLAIIGKPSSAKSTLINALLGREELVRTGSMEETCNVSWLKFGDPHTNINVAFNDGHSESVPRSLWPQWASHHGASELKEQVKYIEVLFNHEMLREVNIIDTPALDDLSQTDSQNTIAFLKEAHPDAVLMLFTQRVAETTMSVIRDYQNAGNSDFNLSPLNAIGVLSNADTIWSVLDSETDIVKIGNRLIANTLYAKYPELRKSLFSIHPVSTLMGLAASTINDDDYATLKALTKIDDVIFGEMISSPEYFADEAYDVQVEPLERQRIRNKFGLYGIYVLTELLRRNKDLHKSLLAEALRTKSGFGKLQLAVQSHITNRATLIKSQTIFRHLLAQIDSAKNSSVGDHFKAVAQVESIIVSALLSLHEFKEWEYLSKYYDGTLNISPQVAEEFMALCGEKGYSAAERLRIPAAAPRQLIDAATERALYWQRQYNVFSVVEPEMAEFYQTMVSAYNLLIIDIRNAEAERRAALETLNRTSDFLGVNNAFSN